MIERMTWWDKYHHHDEVFSDPKYLMERSGWWALEWTMHYDGIGGFLTGNAKSFKTKELRDKFVEENGIESKGEE